jgi:hypothetical protein
MISPTSHASGSSLHALSVASDTRMAPARHVNFSTHIWGSTVGQPDTLTLPGFSSSFQEVGYTNEMSTPLPEQTYWRRVSSGHQFQEKNTLNKGPGDDTVAARDLSAERERAVPFGVRQWGKGRKQGAQYRRPPRQLRGARLVHRHRSGAPAGSAAEAACRGQRTQGRGEGVVGCGRAHRHHTKQHPPSACHVFPSESTMHRMLTVAVRGFAGEKS